jgi:superfamily II DNA/RNA helicase
MNFSNLGLSSEVLRAVADAGYTAPTPIQIEAIPQILAGRDVLGTAQTGTGKTASFALPMIDILAAGRSKARMPRSLVLEPTRELADQVDKSLELYGAYHKLSTALLIGGVAFTEQERKLDRGVDVLIATPGRLLDLVGRGKILLTGVRILVIDEADRMMDMGFMPDVQRIVAQLPRNRQTLFFSATMSPEMRKLADIFLANPKEVSVSAPSAPAANVQQNLIRVSARDKRQALRHLLETELVKNALIFCNRKRDVDGLAKWLVKLGFSAAALHGDMAQSARTEVLERFKTGEILLLVASDVAARGLDVRGLSHVFNFDVPRNPEDYIHRIGRTGRAGLSGQALTLVSPEDEPNVAAIHALTGKDIPAIRRDGIEEPEPVAASGQDAISRGERRRSKSGSKRPRQGQAKADRAVVFDGPSDPKTADTRRNEAGPNDSRLPAPKPRKADEAHGKRAPKGGKRSEVDRDHGQPVVGFGDHVPAFLMHGPLFPNRS